MLIRGGVYRLEKTIVFSLQDSAPDGGTITCAAYGDERPVFTSAVPIVGWIRPQQPSPLMPEIARDAVWTAEVPAKLANVLTLYDGSERLLIRCDNDQYETIIDGNVLYKIRSAQTGISMTETNHVINNIIVDLIPSRRPITKPNIVHGYISIPNPTWPIEGARILRNIIWSPRADYWPIVEHRSLATGAGDRLKDTTTDYNLFWCPADPGWGQRHIDEQRRMGVELHTVSADPMFVDVERGDLRLQAGSTARMLGIEPWDISTAGLLDEHPLHP